MKYKQRQYCLLTFPKAFPGCLPLYVYCDSSVRGSSALFIIVFLSVDIKIDIQHSLRRAVSNFNLFLIIGVVAALRYLLFRGP